MSFWYLQIFQNTNEKFSRISDPASKKGSNQKKLGHLIPLIEGFYFDSLTLLFWFDLFSKARAEILVFWKIWRHLLLNFFTIFESRVKSEPLSNKKEYNIRFCHLDNVLKCCIKSFWSPKSILFSLPLQHSMQKIQFLSPF